MEEAECKRVYLLIKRQINGQTGRRTDVWINKHRETHTMKFFDCAL